MRKKVLGALAALAASAGGALAQGPGPIPAPLAPPPGAIGEMPLPNVDPNSFAPNGLPPGGMPSYPNGGAYGEAPYDSPSMKSGGLFGIGGRGAANPTVWLDMQYLLMFPKAQPLGFPLLTTSAPADAGIVGRPSTTLLHGARDLGYPEASGFRISGGMFRSSDQRVGAEFVGTYLAPSSNIFFASSNSNSNGVPVIARPFIDTGAGGSSLLVSFPTFAFGSALSRTTTKFWGAEANGLLNLYRTGEGDSRHWVLNAIGGFRYNRLAEDIEVTTRGQLLDGNSATVNGLTVGDQESVEVRDSFRTTNSFYGGQIGLQSQFNSGRWYVGVTGKVGVGIIHQELDIQGTTNSSNTINQTNSSGVGGLFANASNIGNSSNDEFGIMTDLNATLGYQITPWLVATVGYNFIHMNNVLRPGNQFTGQVDASTIPTSATFGGVSTGSPNLGLRQQDFHLHGLNFGFILRY